MPVAALSPRFLLIESNAAIAKQIEATFGHFNIRLDAPVHTRNLCTCLGIIFPSLYVAKQEATAKTQPFTRPSGGYAAIILAETYFGLVAADILKDIRMYNRQVPVILGMAHLPPCTPPMVHAVVGRTASRAAPQWDIPALRNTILPLVRPFTTA